MGKKGIETLVGAVRAAGHAGAGLPGSLKAANLGSFGGGDTYQLQARFDNIGGLKERAPVRSAGVTVGRVTGIGSTPQDLPGRGHAGHREAVPVSPRTRRPRSSPPACWATSTSASSPAATTPTWRPAGRRADAERGGAGEPHRPVPHRPGRQRRHGPGPDSGREQAVTARHRLAAAAVLAAALLRAAAPPPEPATPGDPWEGFNRKVFAFNETVDEAVLRPVAETYRDTCRSSCAPASRTSSATSAISGRRPTTSCRARARAASSRACAS
jgi:hypothetical protein